MLVHYLQRVRDRLLGPLPGDGHHDPRVQEDGHHLPHRLPRAIRLLLLDAGGDGGRAGELWLVETGHVTTTLTLIGPGRCRVHLPVRVVQPQRVQHD